MLYTGADALSRKGVIREELWPSHYRNRESSVLRQAAQPHLEDCGIYRMRWWTWRNSWQSYLVYGFFVLYVLVQMVVRLALIDILLALAPIALGLWILPHTAG